METVDSSETLVHVNLLKGIISQKTAIFMLIVGRISSREYVGLDVSSEAVVKTTKHLDVKEYLGR
jgi:hypothetical protein